VTVTLIPQLAVHTTTGIQYLQLTSQTSWSFGRNKDNTVPLRDPWVSRYHAQIEVVGGQQCYLTDLNSRNGTLLNAQLVTTPVLLHDGDRIAMGEVILDFAYVPEVIPEVQPAPTVVSVLMLHRSMSQAYIWQHVLQAKEVPVVWERSASAFQAQLELCAVSKTLPTLLLVDVRAYQGNVYHFCRWSTEKFPEVKIFLIDSCRLEISNFECRVAIKNGAVNLFAALEENNLSSLNFLMQINGVLEVLEKPAFHMGELFRAVKEIELPIENDQDSQLYCSTP
jgi:hypothetical protein